MTWFADQRLMQRLVTHQARGEHAQVVECAALALRNRPDDQVVLSTLARSLDQLGREDEAANIRRRLLEIDPQDRESLFLLARHHESRRDQEAARDLYTCFLDSTQPVVPLQDSDYRFMRFVALLLGGKPDVIESEARSASGRLDRETLARQKYAKRFLSKYGQRRRNTDA